MTELETTFELTHHVHRADTGGLSHLDKYLLCLMVSYLNPTKNVGDRQWAVWPSQETLAYNMRASVRTVQRSLKALVKTGYIKKRSRANTTDEYIINVAKIRASTSTRQSVAPTCQIVAPDLTNCQVGPDTESGKKDIKKKKKKEKEKESTHTLGGTLGETTGEELEMGKTYKGLGTSEDIFGTEHKAQKLAGNKLPPEEILKIVLEGKKKLTNETAVRLWDAINLTAGYSNPFGNHLSPNVRKKYQGFRLQVLAVKSELEFTGMVYAAVNNWKGFCEHVKNATGLPVDAPKPTLWVLYTYPNELLSFYEKKSKGGAGSSIMQKQQKADLEKKNAKD